MQQQEKLSDTHEGMPADHKAELRAWRLNGSMARASIVGLNSTLLLLCHVRGHGGFLRCVCVCVCVLCWKKKQLVGSNGSEALCSVPVIVSFVIY